MFGRLSLTLLKGTLVVSTSLSTGGVALADPAEKFQFGDETYEVPFLPDATDDKMLAAGIEIYTAFSDADKEKFQELRAQKILAHGWLLTQDTLQRWTRPEIETTTRWWELQSIFGEKYTAAKSPHKWVRAFIQSALNSENKNLWRNPGLALGQGKLGFSVAIGHAANFGAYKFGFFSGQMVGITCVPDPPNKLHCAFFFAKERMDRRVPYNFSIEWGLTLRLHRITTDDVERAKVDGVHMTAIGPGAFGSMTGSRMIGWTSTLSIYGLISGYFATAAADPATQLLLASIGGGMWYVQNMALTHTIVEQFNSPRFALDKIGQAYFAFEQKLSAGIERAKSICSRLSTPPPQKLFEDSP